MRTPVGGGPHTDRGAAAGEEYLYNAQASLLRASLTKHDLIQRPAIVSKKGLGLRDPQ